jgi:hypothetical protein
LQQPLLGARLGRAQAAEHEHREAVQPAHQIGEPAERRWIRPVQVVDRQQQRPAGGEVRRQPEEAVQRGEPAVGVPGARVRERAGAEEWRDERRGAAQQLVALGRRGVHDRRLEELAGDPVGELPLELASTRVRDVHAARPRPLPRRAEQARLADAGAALHQHETTGSLACAVDQRGALGELALALQQIGCRRQPGSLLAPILGLFLGGVRIASSAAFAQHGVS